MITHTNACCWSVAKGCATWNRPMADQRTPVHSLTPATQAAAWDAEDVAPLCLLATAMHSARTSRQCEGVIRATLDCSPSLSVKYSEVLLLRSLFEPICTVRDACEDLKRDPSMLMTSRWSALVNQLNCIRKLLPDEVFDHCLDLVESRLGGATSTKSVEVGGLRATVDLRLLIEVHEVLFRVASAVLESTNMLSNRCHTLELEFRPEFPFCGPEVEGP